MECRELSLIQRIFAASDVVMNHFEKSYCVVLSVIYASLILPLQINPRPPANAFQMTERSPAPQIADLTDADSQTPGKLLI